MFFFALNLMFTSNLKAILENVSMNIDPHHKTSVDTDELKHDSLKLKNALRKEVFKNNKAVKCTTIVPDLQSSLLKYSLAENKIERFSISSTETASNLENEEMSGDINTYGERNTKQLYISPQSTKAPLNGNLLFENKVCKDFNSYLTGDSILNKSFFQSLNSNAQELTNNHTSKVGSSCSFATNQQFIDTLSSKEHNYLSSTSSSSSFPFTEKEFNSNNMFTVQKSLFDVSIDEAFYDEKDNKGLNFLAKTETDTTITKNLHKRLTHENLTAVFIGDLSINMNEKRLKEYFKEFKSLTSVKICRSISTDKPLGHGYLNFLNRNEAMEAIEKYNYTPMGGKEVRMMESLRNSFFRKNMGTNVFFSNMPLDKVHITTREFYDIFKHYGKIYSCKLDKRKFIGFIYFENDAIAARVIDDYNDKLFHGVTIKCGIHFDKDVRNLPEFGRRISKLDKTKLIKETIVTEKNEIISSDMPPNDDHGNRAAHPNAIYIIGLPKSCNNDVTLDLFSRAGPIKSVHTCPKYNSNYRYGYVTFKKGADCQEAIKMFDSKLVKGRYIKVGKADKKAVIESLYEANKVDQIIVDDFQEVFYTDADHYKATVYLSNLSEVCNSEFVAEICKQNNIKIREIKIKWFNQQTCTFAGYANCENDHEATKLFKFMNCRLIGDTVTESSWQVNKNNTLVVKEPSMHISMKHRQLQKSCLAKIDNNCKKNKFSNKYTCFHSKKISKKQQNSFYD